MKIANPLYDAAFKYAMEDPEVAKDMLSLLLNLNIISVVLLSQEVTMETSLGIRVFRLDFKATIRTKTGEIRNVLIEIQKSKRSFKVIRFRRYLGYSYCDEHDIINDKDEIEKACLPITSIYFLGYRLKNIRVPVAKIVREYRNALTDRPLKMIKKLEDKTKIKVNAKEDFVEQLSHDTYVIQIPRLKMVAQTELEKMLDVFSQTKYKTLGKYFSEFTGDMNDPRVARLVKRLHRGIIDGDLLHAMYVEDEIESMLDDHLKELDRVTIAKDQAVIAKEEERKAKEEERKAKEEALLKVERLEQELAEFKAKNSEKSDS